MKDNTVTTFLECRNRSRVQMSQRTRTTIGPSRGKKRSNARTTCRERRATSPSARDRRTILGQRFRSLQQELSRVKEVVKGRAQDTMDTLVQQTESPFTTEVLRYPLPAKFRMPQWKHPMESKIPSTTSILTKIKWSCMGITTLYDAGLSPPH